MQTTISNNSDYQRIEAAILYIQANFHRQPELEEIAAAVNLSPFHFQRMFSSWAGVSPKKFGRYLTISYAKALLRENSATVFDAAFEVGLSGSGRLHEMFVTLEGMTPGEYKNGGADLAIDTGFYETAFGAVLVGSTHKGICWLSFCTGTFDDSMKELVTEFPNAQFRQLEVAVHQQALAFFNKHNDPANVHLHLKGTPFQLKVWEALLKIPSGDLSTYKSLAGSAGATNASRAVGTAIGQNPVAYIIPCHRVIRSTGEWGQYRWGAARKTGLIGWEAAQRNASHEKD
jgi:AraC family transcriptional regulator of adaptative response/methylated-DNA-[protein]-cysteine methyltransferase